MFNITLKKTRCAITSSQIVSLLNNVEKAYSSTTQTSILATRPKWSFSAISEKHDILICCDTIRGDKSTITVHGEEQREREGERENATASLGLGDRRKKYGGPLDCKRINSARSIIPPVTLIKTELYKVSAGKL